MSPRRDSQRGKPEQIDERLQAARPGDADAAELEAAAARVQARFALRRQSVSGDEADAELVGASTGPAVGTTGAVLAVVCVVLCGGLTLWNARSPSGAHATSTLGSNTSSAEGTSSETPSPDEAARPPGGFDSPAHPERSGGDAPAASVAWLLPALDGEPEARNAARGAGRSGRELLLALAERGGERAGDALRLLRSFGRLSRRDEIERVAVLMHRPALAGDALDWLVSDAGAHAPRVLGRLLVDLPEREQEIVAGLEALAGRGRRRAVVRALVGAVEHGRVLATAAAVRLGGAETLPDLLEGLPEDLHDDPSLLAALQEGSASFRARLRRLASSGDERALALTARLGETRIVPRLRAWTLGDDAERARRGIALLERIEAPAAWVALGDATEGPAAFAAWSALDGLPRRAVDDLARHAMADRRATASALRALSGIGPAGRARVALLGAQPVLAPDAVRVLALAPGADAAMHLASLLGTGGLDREVIAALGARLAQGDAAAGEALLAAASKMRSRSIVDALASAGEIGRPYLERAQHIDALARRARESLRAADASVAGARPPVRARGSRSGGASAGV